MGFNTFYRFSVHAVIFNDQNQVLLLKQNYDDQRWGLPGGGIEPGETIHEAIRRECREELGVDVEIQAFTGLYYHKEFNAQVGIFRCGLPADARIILGSEHTDYAWTTIADLSEIQRIRVQNALEFGADVASQAF